MKNRILSLAIPNIITNITVPLLGMVDMAIVGHLSSTHIGAITIGTGIFNLIYWCFGFLRMGTSGFAAQAYGSRRLDEAVKILIRGFVIAFGIALLLLILQWPISRLALVIFHGSGEVMDLALTYFFIRIWAAPATLGLYALKGWYIGMQNSRLPMWIAIFINIVNIICSLLFVIVFKWDIAGVALGTVIAQYSGLIIGIFFAHHFYGRTIRRYFDIKGSLNLSEMKSFFKVNGDIFFRTICLAAVFTFITAASGRISDEILAVDALLLQFFTLFSYVMDGFAYAGESLIGRYIGAKDLPKLKHTVRSLFLWGLSMTLTFTLIYAAFDRPILALFSNDAALVESTHSYILWILAIPICGVSAFLFDGIYVGATASRQMRNAMIAATATFFILYYGLKIVYPPMSDTSANNHLWAAFMVYLSVRGIVQALLLKNAVYKKAEP